MGYLLDTCVLSELSSARPNPRVVQALTALPRDELFVSAMSLGELNQGIEQLPPSSRKTFLLNWFVQSVLNVFAAQTVDVDTAVALKWGQLRANLAARGHSIQVIDGILAATALVHGLVVVTRNEKDFAATGVAILNPWK